jgi:hypothetical protein
VHAGWCALHNLANAAAKAAAGGPWQQQLYSIMLETVQHVQQVAEGVRGASKNSRDLADALLRMYVCPEQPSWHFEGHRFMDQLKRDLVQLQPQIPFIA